jgi:hypothetical protein
MHLLANKPVHRGHLFQEEELAAQRGNVQLHFLAPPHLPYHPTYLPIHQRLARHLMARQEARYYYRPLLNLNCKLPSAAQTTLAFSPIWSNSSSDSTTFLIRLRVDVYLEPRAVCESEASDEALEGRPADTREDILALGERRRLGTVMTRHTLALNYTKSILRHCSTITGTKSQ